MDSTLKQQALVSPVFEVSENGCILSSNKSGIKFLSIWKTGIGQEVPVPMKKIVMLSYSTQTIQSYTVNLKNKTYLFLSVPTVQEKKVSLYGSFKSNLNSVSEENTANIKSYQDIINYFVK